MADNLSPQQFKRDRGHMMWAGRSHYVFNVHVASHEEVMAGKHDARLTQVAIARETGEPEEYWQAKDTAALLAAHRHKGMPTRVEPHYQED